MTHAATWFGTPVLRHVQIPMPDGVTLSADLYLPDADALDGRRRFPVAFDYYPYRKDDGMTRLTRMHRDLAERGYVAVRIDVRGTGGSGGTAVDEYCPQEQLDGVAAIAWLAEQPWSSGRVGMFGTSYGGFNSLQVAMHRPPALKAICPMYFTDNRYTDDCHYKGGALQMLYDVGTYGLSMVAANLLPPRPDLVGERWAAIWEEHLRERAVAAALAGAPDAGRAVAAGVALRELRRDRVRRPTSSAAGATATPTAICAHSRTCVPEEGADRPVAARATACRPAGTAHRHHARDGALLRPTG